MNIVLGYPKFHVLICFMKYYSFIEQRQSKIKMSLKYTGGYIRVVGKWKLGNLFCRPKILLNDLLSFGVGRN